MKAVKLIGKLLIAGPVAVAALFWSGEVPTRETTSFVTSAEAWVGAPATPRSYAGVARRTTRRTVAAGAAVGTAVGVATVGAATATTARAAAVATAPNCARVTGPYGRTATVCR
jgi:hypothetical protein